MRCFFILCLLTLPLFAADKAVKPDQSEAEKRLAALGSLKDDLGIWMGMDSTERGGVTWTRFPLRVSASGPVQESKTARRQWLDYSKSPAQLRFEEPLDLGKKYTICVWVLFPSPHSHALIWQAGNTGGGAVFTDDREVFCWDDAINSNVKLATFPAKQEGWQHLAITADGKVTRTFLNGKETGQLEGVPLTRFLTMGNSWITKHQHWMMANGLDDHFVFRRPLTAEEIQKVMRFERPAEETKK